MKKKLVKPLALVLCGVLLASGNSMTVSAAGPVILEKETEISKDETVYVLAGADGSVEKIIVSDWIKNTPGSETLTDKTDLTDIENVKGDETYAIDGNNTCIWDAQGNDVYYQGNIEKELPVTISVSYTLDGQTVTPSELAGKSGRLTIRYDYVNHQYGMAEINGRQEKIYVPFAMLTGMLLDNEVFSNVEVSNGKLFNEGSRTAVVGIAFPGLQDNLNIESDKLTVPDYVEITADVKDFELTNAITIATNEIFNRLNSDKLDSPDELTESLDKLTDAMNQLLDGSSKLYNGLCTLLDKSGELVQGINQLADGAAKLKNGTGDLNKGASDLAGGVKTLSDGLGELNGNSKQLKDGSGQVFQSLLSMADGELAAAGLSVPKLTIENYAEVLNGVIASLDETHVAEQAKAVALQKVTAAVNAEKDKVQTGVTAAARAQVEEQVTAGAYEKVETEVLKALGMTKEQYDSAVAAGAVSAEQQAQVNGAIETQMASTETQAIIAANIEDAMKSAAVQATIAAQTDKQIKLLIEQNMKSPEVQEQITAALGAAKSGAASISALKQQLDSYNTFHNGLCAYTAGVGSAKAGADQLAAGAGQLKAGASELNAGMGELYNGIATLKDGAPILISGITALRDGAMQLSDGLKELNEKGIEKLVDAVDGDLDDITARIQATLDISKNYNSFAGIADEMDGKVKFIYRTDEITTKNNK